MALSSGVKEDPRDDTRPSELEGNRLGGPLFVPGGITIRSGSPRSATGDVVNSPRRNRELILSPIRLRNGSSGMLSRQFARDVDRWRGCWGTYSWTWSGVSQICAAWVRNENHKPMA